MERKVLLELVQRSYTKGELDEDTVKRIAALLPRKTLKAYIKALKFFEKKRTVTIAVSSTSVLDEKELMHYFPNKKVEMILDPSLLAGLHIEQDDIVYDYNLKQRLEQAVQETVENYDR